MFSLNETHLELQSAARRLAVDVIAGRAAEVDRSEAYPWHNVEELTRAGFMGMTIPEQWGGRGLSFLHAVLVVEEMAKVEQFPRMEGRQMIMVMAPRRT